MGRRKLDEYDLLSEREGRAIDRHRRLSVHAPRLRKSYKCDGFTFPTGNRHRNVIQTAC